MSYFRLKKALSLIICAAGAAVLGGFSAAAEDVSVETAFAEETSDGVSFTVNSETLAASQFKDDTVITVSCTGGEGEECPIKLVINYWNNDMKLNDRMGEPASVEVAPSEYKDGKATYTYEEISKALNGADPGFVYSIDVASAGQTITCTGFEAANVYSAAEAVDMGLLRAICVHAEVPQTSENWGQSMTIGVDEFDTSYLTAESVAMARFETGEDTKPVSSPVELILQSNDDTVSPKAKKGTVWAKVSPLIYNANYAMFDYKSMVKAYGTDDFSCVATVYLGDTGKLPLTATDLIVTKCKTAAPPKTAEPADSSEPEEESSAVTTTEAASSAPEETTAAAVQSEASEAPASSAAASSSAADGSMSSHIIFIIIGVVAGVIIAVVVVFIVLTKKAGQAYDVNKHKFIKK